MKLHSDAQNRIFVRVLDAIHIQTGRLFFWLLIAQWVFAIALTLWVSPYSWVGTVRMLHIHVEAAILLGGLISAPPLVLLRVRPGWWVTRHAVAVAQVLWSALLIHVTGGRIETHFHIFGSLAFLAFYRDWRVLVTATLVVVADHLTRGFFWPESVYGIANPEWWRFLEHGAWVIFEDTVLILGCQRSLIEMRVVADREAALEELNADVERQVRERTTELEAANSSLAAEMKTRLQAEANLRQGQKLEAVGRLASGVAHEINTPVQFVGDSIHFLREATTELIGVVEKLQLVQQSVLDGAPSRDAALNAMAAIEVADLPYLLENIPKALECSVDGLGRVSTIVQSMKEFAHPDSTTMSLVDLNRGIESTLVIARNEYKFVADIETDLGSLPAVACYASDINQVVLNMLVNASHAIADAVKGTQGRGRIVVRTRQDKDHVVLSIGDTGGGMSEEIRERIFDPFFTTKVVGKGTGQGLAIARNIVVEKHGGEVTVESEVGKGTTFFIRLPLNGRIAHPTSVVQPSR
jgi:signal transduction histidine kinase